MTNTTQFLNLNDQLYSVETWETNYTPKIKLRAQYYSLV